jgi:DNA-directed RNA polymerase specialized sigma24 family protein
MDRNCELAIQGARRTVMSDAPRTLVYHLRVCIVQGHSGPWPELLILLWELIERAFMSAAPEHHRGLIGEFREWLPGWLITRQQLEAAQNWLDERVQTGECSSANEQESALRNYLSQVFRSGVGDFFRERVGRSETARALRRLSQTVDTEREARSERFSAVDQESLVLVRKRLAALPLSLRIPFRLQHFEACGPLLEDEIAFVAERSGLPPETIASRIDAELKEHRGAEFPIGAEFIGQLLGIPPSADGRFSAVHARVSRARQRLRDQLAPREEQP